MDGARQIVICCDGTNNTVTGRERDTNVLRLYEHVRARADDRQLLYYDPGVGSPDALPPTSPVDWLSRKWERASGLAVGRGAFENIGEAYLFLMRHWAPGTQVWIFGFSRGAFTARSLSGMVQLFGILAPHHDALLPTLLRVYFAPREDEVPPSVQRQRMKMAETIAGVEAETNALRTRGDVAQQLREGFTTPDSRDAGVHFVGVWDTVAAIGMPGLSLRMSSPARIGGTRIAHARHAVALDEHRLSFMPRLYEEDDFGAPDGEQSLRQRWFRGVHGDSGGGYAPQESGLSDAALHWMVDEAIACGLRCAPVAAGEAQALVHDPVHTVPWWAATGLALRDTSPLVREAAGAAPRPLAPVQHPSVAAVAPGLRSVWQRRRAWPPLVLALLGTFVFGTAHGLLLLGHPASLVRAWETGARFAWMQLSMLWAGPQWRELWESVPRGNPVSAMLMDFGVVASYAYLLGRWTSWAFVRRAGLREVGQPVPAWQWLGRALPVAIAGDVFENVMTLLALGLEGWPVPVLLWLGSAGALAKWVGLAGCGALLLIGLWPSGGARSRRHRGLHAPDRG